jgi:hypothetical protein
MLYCYHTNMTTKTTTVLITGNTFPVKDQLKALGGRWDAESKGWRVPADKAVEAQELAGPKTTSPWNGYPYRPRYNRRLAFAFFTSDYDGT